MIIESKNNSIRVSGTTIPLPYSKLELGLFNPSYIEKKSLNGKIKYIKKSDGVLFNLLIYLFKYNQPNEFISQINQIKGKEIEIILENGSIIPLFPIEFRYLYLFNKINYDILKITLINIADVKISNYIITKDGKILKTKLSQLIRTRGLVI